MSNSSSRVPSVSPALGLDVVHVGMLADLDRRHRAADIDAVLHYGFVRGELPDRELVPDRDVAARTDLDLSILVHDPADQLLPRFHAFDDDHPDRVAFIVHNEMNHGVAAASGKTDCPR